MDVLSVSKDSKNALAYIYFDHEDSKSYDRENVIRNLYKQLLLSRSIPKGLEDSYDEYIKSEKYLDFSTLKKHLISIITCSSTCPTIFLDALDECRADGFKNMADLIHELKSAGAKIFCTSRIDPIHIRDSNIGIPDWTIEIKANEQDVRHYLSSTLDEKWHHGEESRLQILDSLAKTCQGKFFRFFLR